MHDYIAWNDRMPNINAAIGLAQLENLDDYLEKKRILKEKYISQFSKKYPLISSRRFSNARLSNVSSLEEFGRSRNKTWVPYDVSTTPHEPGRRDSPLCFTCWYLCVYWVSKWFSKRVSERIKNCDVPLVIRTSLVWVLCSFETHNPIVAPRSRTLAMSLYVRLKM